ncbi:MAG: acyl carrier protein [Cellulomonadaceae bacterium]|jgi:acyl carrier protein|nr:acyl carrier protein [Cellulomonadaceae bacterium]
MAEVTREEIVETITQCIHEEMSSPDDEYDGPDVTSDARFSEDLDVDSLSLMSIVTHVEDLLSVRVPDADLRSFATVGSLVDFVQDATASRT